MLMRRRAVFLPWIFCCVTLCLRAAEPAPAQNFPAFPPGSNSAPRFNVRVYLVKGSPLLPTNTLTSVFSPYTGTDMSLDGIVKAASALQLEYHHQGCPAVSVAFVPERITGGVVTFNVARTAIPQIVVAGERYLSLGNGVEIVSQPPAAGPVLPAKPPVGTATNAIAAGTTHSSPPATNLAPRRVTYEEMVDATAAMHLKMAELDSAAQDTRVHVVSTNAGPRFEVEKYLVDGNTILPLATLGQAITNIDGAFGTNVGFDGIETVVTELGKAYHERGYVTVVVNVPQQKLTNATVKLQVLEGRLADIKVTGNHYFSSNNVMRALPSLHPNTVLNGPIFNAELNRANASQDRQIYPVIGPGPEPGTSELTLNVKDRLPLHTKVELNNQASPGTPELRVNASAIADNLWQRENSLGVQYGFSPEHYKQGNQWNLYDEPLVANYGAFYRLPLGGPEPIEDLVANNPGSFGYSEATRQFRLPPPSGRMELNLFASRSTIDTGVMNQPSKYIIPPGGAITVSSSSAQESLTVNNDLGLRLTVPARSTSDFQSSFSAGPDFKTYSLNNYATNYFFFTYTIANPQRPGLFITSTSIDASPNNAPPEDLEYLPLSLSYDATWRNPTVTFGFGLDMSGNPWYSGSKANLQAIADSSQSSGYWVKLAPSLSADFVLPHDWMFSARANGQWVNEPVISNEQFGAGGVNSVRGYHEGEVFGDTGWHLSLEQKTPAYTVGLVRDGTPLIVHGSVYMDYARVYLVDPHGRQGSTPLWGTGFGMAALVGSHWQAQFLFSWPLLNAGTVPAYQPFFNFALTAQF
jgi:hemolysin activation/secretion protein